MGEEDGLLSGALAGQGLDLGYFNPNLTLSGSGGPAARLGAQRPDQGAGAQRGGAELRMHKLRCSRAVQARVRAGAMRLSHMAGQGCET